MGIDITEIKFDKQGLIPAIAQDVSTGRVLMLAYMTKEALGKTIETKRAHYYSRSRNTLWKKGETSGNFQEVESIHYDCDKDAILLMVRQIGVSCHTGEMSCFFRTLGKEKPPRPIGAWILGELFEVLKDRKKHPTHARGTHAKHGSGCPEKSYVSTLYAKGLNKILEKIKEESDELIEAAEKKDKKELIHELCDLWFHTLILLGYRDVGIYELFKEFSKRSGTSGLEEKRLRNKSITAKNAK